MSLKYEDWKYFKMAAKFKMVAKIKMADLVLMQRRIQGNKRYMYVQFGVDGKLHVEVTKP